ncbi:MAG: SGNH/GDSL hydrolase family protein [Pseudanabaena sp.]|jgi:lysophospholipase L1-like esterase
MNKIYFAIATIVILLCGYFGLNFWLLDNRTPSNSMTESFGSDPYELSTYPINPDLSKRDLNKPLVVFFGDSRAVAWPAIANIPFEFINRGINGQTTNQVLGRLSAHVASLSPQIVVVQVGVNDLRDFAEFPDKSRNIVNNCKQNIQKIVNRLTQELKATVILTTIFPTSELSQSVRAYWPEEADRAIIEINQFIKSLKSDRVIILDAATLLADERGNVRQIYSRDILHLNSQGYKMLNDELIKILTNKNP